MSNKKLNKLKKQLLLLKEKVDEQDIMKAALDTGNSYYTVKRYLNGEVKKEPVAEKLIKFFNEAIAEAA
jgi:hypothetical protein